MPPAVFKKLGLGTPRPTTMRLLMVDPTVKRPIGILYDVLVKVDRFIFPANFVILKCEVDSRLLYLQSTSLIFIRRNMSINIQTLFPLRETGSCSKLSVDLCSTIYQGEASATESMSNSINSFSFYEGQKFIIKAKNYP